MSINNLGSLLQDQGKLAEAEATLLSAAAIADATLPARHQIRMALTRNIKKLYEARDRAEPGAGFDAKAAEWNAKLELLSKPAEQPAPGAK
jgi:hypothetical protein